MGNAWPLASPPIRSDSIAEARKLSLHRPRRIFRRAKAAPPGSAGRTLAFGVLAVAAVAAVSLVAQPGILFGRVPPPAVVTAEAGQVSVVDGSTLRLHDRVLRLDRMTAPARGAGCAVGRDCAGTAAQTLAALVRDRRVECKPDGHDEAGRPYAACSAGGQDLSTAMVLAGWGWATDAVLHGAEDTARAGRVGMWAAR